MQTLRDLAEGLYFPRKLEIGPETRRQYLYSLDDFGRTLGHEPTVEDLSDDNLLIWMRRLMDRQPPLSPHTINERCGRVRTLWNWLARRGVVTTWPTVRRIAAPDPVPRAWDHDELRRLFEAADLEGGMIGPVPSRLWWRARLLWHWHTAARKSETDALQQEWIDLRHAVAVVPAAVRKGRKKTAVYHLPPALIESLERIWQPARVLMFPWDKSPTVYWLRWNRILRNAGLPAGRRSKTQALRVSHATWAKRLGGDPTQALLHSDPATTARHYLDKRFEPPPKPLPGE